MKSRKIICFCILTLVMMISVNNILAETAGTGVMEFNAENAVITEPGDQLSCYDVTYRNFHKAYTPEMFNASGVKSKEYQKVDGREIEDWYRFEFQDGCELYIPSGLSLIYGDARVEYYSQVLTYLQWDLGTMECTDMEGFSLEEARKKADALIAVLDIENLEPDLAVSLSHEDLSRITKEMRETPHKPVTSSTCVLCPGFDGNVQKMIYGFFHAVNGVAVKPVRHNATKLKKH